MSRDLACAECSRVFKWGQDADSGLADIPPNCGQNAYWKLVAHMWLEHPDCLMRFRDYDRRTREEIEVSRGFYRLPFFMTIERKGDQAA